MAEATQEIVDEVKAKNPDREVKVLALPYRDEEMHFVLVSPMRDEWRKIQRELNTAGDNTEKLTDAIERAALMLVRWPSLDELKSLFNKRPGVILQFGNPIAELAGVGSEVLEKKLQPPTTP